MNQPFSGGWRFTSNDALANLPMGGGLLGNRITPEFLKQVAAMGAPQKSALEQATQAKPLDGLLSADERSGNDGGAFGAQQAGGPTYGMNAAGNWAEMQPGGLTFGLNPSAKTGMGFLSGGIPGALLGSLQVQRTAPVETIVDTNYGASLTRQGPPTEAQAKALAAMLARDLAGYGGGFANADGSYGGYDGLSGGPDTGGFGGVY